MTIKCEFVVGTTRSKYSLRKKKERYCLVTTKIIGVSDVVLTRNKVKRLK